MTTIPAIQLLVIFLLVLLRLMERSFEKSITPFDPLDKLDHRLHFDRKPRDTVGKSYDPIAREQLRKTLERRRQPNADNGQRRRRNDR